MSHIIQYKNFGSNAYVLFDLNITTCNVSEVNAVQKAKDMALIKRN